MAKETVVEVLDDLGDGEAVESLTFALRGVEYEIDLSAKNVAALDRIFGKYLVAGRPVIHRRSRMGSLPYARKSEGAQIRAWARASGYRISDRGRISEEVLGAFELALI